MTKQYWIGDIFVDLSRNQMIVNRKIQTIAPKALAVLTHLAKYENQVVSQNSLLDHVWGDAVVSPNTLQRSITQLRKAMGDDGKTIIKTHAKQGYSLEGNVSWSTEQPSQDSSFAYENKSGIHNQRESIIKGKISTNSIASRMLIFIVLVLMGIIIVEYRNAPSETAKLAFSEIRPLTATDNKEFAGIYSPNGKYVVFHRYSDALCQNNLWAKDIQTKQEFKLTKNLGTYSSHSFSQDGKSLVLIGSHDCSKPITQKICYQLMSLDFDKALQSPQALTEIMTCNHSEIQHPVRLNNGEVAMLQKQAQRWQLIRYSEQENHSKILFSIDDGNVVDFDYSPTDDLMVVTSLDKEDNYYINKVRVNGEVLSSRPIIFPDEVAKYRLIAPNFSPLDGHYIFSTGRQLFALSDEGQVTRIDLLLDEPMGTPVFHPNHKRMVAVTGHYDSDIVTMPFTQIQASVSTSESSVFQTLERSSTGEYNAISQPGGDIIAFNSKRSGEQQVWLSDAGNVSQLTDFPLDTYLVGMSWARDGESLLVNANHQLYQVFLDGQIQHYPIRRSVEQLFHWDSNMNRALSLIRMDGVATLAEIELDTGKLIVITDKAVTWAQKFNDDVIIYSDHMDRFWRPGPVGDELIEMLDGYGSDKRFVVNNGVMYGVSADRRLWAFELEENSLEILGEVPQNLDHITDVDDTALFGVVRVSAKKELVELLLK